MSPLLHEATDQELAAEFERRSNAGRMGWHGMYSTNQINYREAWTDAMDQLHQRCNDDFDRWNPHRTMMQEALERHLGVATERREVYAINTTYHGRSAFENHAPESPQE